MLVTETQTIYSGRRLEYTTQISDYILTAYWLGTQTHPDTLLPLCNVAQLAMNLGVLVLRVKGNF